MAFSPKGFVQSVVESIQSFATQSERVLNVTHKPKGEEFRRIAYITAIGMAIIGLTGFVISMAGVFLRGS